MTATKEPSRALLAEPVAASVLRDYAFIADGERGAIIGPTGEIAWLCFPTWADEPLFASLLGGTRRYVIRPTTRFVWGGQYEGGSLIWRSRWVVGGETVECREVLAFPGLPDHAVLVRRVQAITGPAEIDVLLDVREDGRGPLRRTDDGCWTGRSQEASIRWRSAVEVRDHDGRLAARVPLTRGQPVDFVLELARGELPGDPANPDEVLAATTQAWRTTVPVLEATAAPRDARLAVAVLRGMTSRTGAMVAAATTSMPERANEGRDYDYRYAWIRDQCYAGTAAASHPEAAAVLLDASVRFVHERLLDDGPDLKPAYRIDGGPVPPIEPLDLAGYPGAPRVNAGNLARDQFQLDTFGEALTMFAAAATLDRVDGEVWRAARVAVDAIEQRLDEPDHGIWEVRPRRYTHSRLACVAGLRAVARVAAPGPEPSRWLSMADAIVADVAKTSVHRGGWWQRAPDDDRLDASLLLPAIRGALPVDDPRAVATRRAVRDQLLDDGYVYRYPVADEPLGQAEGAFLLCGFWFALACWQAGSRETAWRVFERNRAACGTPGLFTEEYDVHQRQLRGDFPQAFVHALLLETACTFGPEEER